LGSRIWIAYSAGEVSTNADTAEIEAVAEAVAAGVMHAGASGSSEVYSVATASSASCSFTGSGEAASEAAVS
jgi:hypothetical protein